MVFQAWHYEIDTVPHVFPVTVAGQPRLELRVPVGVVAQPPHAFNIVLEVTIDGGAMFRIGFDTTNANGFVRRITNATIFQDQSTDLKAARWYLSMREQFAVSTNQYFEAAILNIPIGAEVRYTIKVLPLAQPAQQLGPYTFRAVQSPAFARSDIIAMTDEGQDHVDSSVVYYRQDAQFHYVRVDHPNITTTRLNYELEVGPQLYRLREPSFHPEQLPALPIVDPFMDTVLVAVPKSAVPNVATIRWRGTSYAVNTPVNVGQARIMFVHFGIQGLNDLFETPDKSYTPPKSYMQITMEDEQGRYSSRPNSVEEVGIGDGYIYTIDAHRKYDVPYLWAFNSGVLTLIAQDCPDDLTRIRKEVSDGLMEPAIAGFGAHRIPYYQEETNRYSMQTSIDMNISHCGASNDVYYPDQRVYKQLANVMNALANANTIRYLVADASTAFDPYASSKVPNANAGQAFLDAHYLWQDQRTGLYLLFIADDVRGQLLGAEYPEWTRGKLSLNLKKKLFHFAANPVVRRNHLMVYGDDAEKASGNGWFDGRYAGSSEIPFRSIFDAALEWIAAHPWIVPIRSVDLDPNVDCVGTINMETAIDPSLDPGGINTDDAYGQKLHFDTWYDNWKAFRAVWVDQTLEEISQSIEYAILDWPNQFHNELYDLGKMSFSMALHESQWNKQPLEDVDRKGPNDRRDVVEPEDFIITASLQTRNAQVYLNAAVWAEWAAGGAGGGAVHLNGGPVINDLQAIQYQNAGNRPAQYQSRPILADPLRWDRDPLQNVILYNRDLLIVMDANGGRITHLFAMIDGKARCVSGTFKAYQFLTDAKVFGSNVVCDGEILQNTVYTPNHAYIACDVRESRGNIGIKFNPKTGVETELECYYPDNFNAYEFRAVGGDTVEWKYTQTVPMPVMNIVDLRAHLLDDRVRKLNRAAGVVFHESPDFRKEITLSGRTIQIRYFGTPAGHVVANEFCVDLHAGVVNPKEHTRLNQVSQTEMTVLNKAGVCVVLKDLVNCAFTAKTLDPEDERGRLHRVLTDCIELESVAGGSFSYTVTVPTNAVPADPAPDT